MLRPTSSGYLRMAKNASFTTRAQTDFCRGNTSQLEKNLIFRRENIKKKSILLCLCEGAVADFLMAQWSVSFSVVGKVRNGVGNLSASTWGPR